MTTTLKPCYNNFARGGLAHLFISRRKFIYMSQTFFDLVWKNWSRPITEITGWVVDKTKDGYVILANTIGVSKDDLKLDFDGDTLTLGGKTEIMGGFFTSANYRWNIAGLRKNIKSIDYIVKDGFTYIYILTKEEDRPEIKISYRAS